MSKILMVVSAADSLTLADGTEHPTGFWAEELVVAHRDLTSAGHEVVIATPGGATPTVDPASMSGDADAVAGFRAYLDSIAADLERPLPLAAVDPADYAAVVLPGGHGPMTDLARDADLGRILRTADAAATVIAPFCHGPAGLLSAADTFAGRRVAVFTNEEELAGGLGENAPWFVATALTEAGVVVETGAPWSSHVVRDGNLISGQNPQSSAAVAAAVVDALAGRLSPAAP